MRSAVAGSEYLRGSVRVFGADTKADSVGQRQAWLQTARVIGPQHRFDAGGFQSGVRELGLDSIGERSYDDERRVAHRSSLAPDHGGH